MSAQGPRQDAEPRVAEIDEVVRDAYHRAPLVVAHCGMDALPVCSPHQNVRQLLAVKQREYRMVVARADDRESVHAPLYQSAHAPDLRLLIPAMAGQKDGVVQAFQVIKG